MGEAARRKAEIAAIKSKNEDWLASLPSDEALVARVSIMAYNKIVVGMGMTEGCYNLTFFLHEFLRRKFGIQVKIIIGWVNDGDWDGATSHAWIEYHDKKIDIALNKTSHPDVQTPGNLIILDHVYRNGQVSYRYWESLPQDVADTMDMMAGKSIEFARAYAHKKAEHQQMLTFAESIDGIENYFRNAPPSNRYENLAQIVDRGLELMS